MISINLEGKNALVCGASKGIGKAIAFALADCGANVCLLARNEEALKSHIQEMPKSRNQKHRYLVADMNNLQSVEQTFDKLVSEPHFDILINNSGGPAAGKLFLADQFQLEQAFRQHVLCAHLLSKKVLEGMKTAGYGRIINIISTSVKQPLDNLGVSNTVRAAMASWAKTLANEVAIYGITVNNVLPGATETDRLLDIISKESSLHGKSVDKIKEAMIQNIPANRFGQPSEIANVVAFLASPLAAYINGINLPVDGGRTKCL